MNYRKGILTVVLFSLIIMVGSVVAQDIDNMKFPKLNKLAVPEVERVTLDNGMRLYLLEDKSLPIFRASVRVNCGTYLEPAEKVGLAGITGSVLRTGGTKKWTGDEIDELLESVGASVETGIGRLSGSASVNTLSEYSDLGLEVLAQVLRYPVFDQDKIDLAKIQTKSGIGRRNDDAQQIAIREFIKLIYGADSPYARQVEYATIDAIERDDLVAYHSKYYKPQNIQLAIWGDFDKKELLKKINTFFGDWKKEGDPVPPPPTVDYKFESGVYYINKEDVNQTNIVLGHIGGMTTDPDYADRIVMNNILGGGFGSRLFSQVRSKEGLAYAVSGSYTSNISYPGIFYGFASTKSETTIKAVKEIIKQMKTMQTDPATVDEMRGGKDGYLNSFVFNFDTKSEVVNRLMRYDFYGLPDDYLSQEKEKIEKVTPEGIMAAANKNLRPDAVKIIVVGKVADFEMPLDQAGLGAVTEIDITIPIVEKKQELVINEETLAQGSAIFAKAVEAAGGSDAYKAIKSIYRKGQMLMVTPQGEFPLNFESTDVFPDQSRTVITVFGQTIYMIRNAMGGWKTDQRTMEVVAMTEEDLVKEIKDATRSNLMIFTRAGDADFKVVYNGSGTENGIAVEYVSILDDEQNELCKYGINAQTFELVSKSYWGETQAGEGSVTEILSDFADVSGIKYPMTKVISADGQKVSTFKTAECTINIDVPAGSFDKP